MSLRANLFPKLIVLTFLLMAALDQARLASTYAPSLNGAARAALNSIGVVGPLVVLVIACILVVRRAQGQWLLASALNFGFVEVARAVIVTVTLFTVWAGAGTDPQSLTNIGLTAVLGVAAALVISYFIVGIREWRED